MGQAPVEREDGFLRFHEVGVVTHAIIPGRMVSDRRQIASEEFLQDGELRSHLLSGCNYKLWANSASKMVGTKLYPMGVGDCSGWPDRRIVPYESNRLLSGKVGFDAVLKKCSSDLVSPHEVGWISSLT